MGFQVSPGVEIKEFDLTAIVPAVSTTPAGFVGAFQWGPAEQRVLINSEKTLRETFFTPSKEIFYSTSWFVAQNFLTYGSNLVVGRALLADDSNAFTPGSKWTNTEGDAQIPTNSNVVIKNRQDFESQFDARTFGSWDFTFAAKYPGTLGNSLQVIVYDINASDFTVDNLSNTNLGGKALSEADARAVINYVNRLPVDTSSYAANINSAAEDEIHVIVIDKDGKITGDKNTILESYLGLSKAPSAKNPDGTTNYWRNVINNKSLYIWAGESPVFGNIAPEDRDQTGKPVRYYGQTETGNDWDTEVDLNTPYNRCGIMVHELDYGTLTSVTDLNRPQVEAAVVAGMEFLFGDAEEVDVSLLIAGDLKSVNNNNAVIALAENRKDCVAFVSPPTEDVIDAASIEKAQTVLDYRNGEGDYEGQVGVLSSSYGVMDSGPKYQYDRYNDRFIYVPMCGDIAGCCVRTDTTREPWYSPAGYDRGRINNIVKLVYNPNKEQRDLLYQKGVNPVVTFQGSGAILFGDKTLQLKASAFDRINVRRLFIVLEKAIATAAKFQLFEFNDAFTRNQFRQLVEPFLRDVQGRRGISSYAVICDETNNPPSIVDSNQFVADIFVAPARSINFIKLNFVATPTGVQFAEFGG